MTGDDTQGGSVNGRLAAVAIELPRPLRDVFAAQQFGGAFSNEFMAGAMEAPTPDAQVMPGLRHSVAHRRLGRPLVKSSLEEANQRRAWHPLGKEPDAGNVRWIVGWCDVVAEFHRLNDSFIQPHA